MTQAGSRPREIRPHHLLTLAAIVLCALVLRMPALLRLDYHIAPVDEHYVISNPEHLGLYNRPYPRFVYYPALAYYPHALTFRVARELSKRPGADPLVGPSGGPVHDTKERIYRIARNTQRVTGVLTVVATFFAGRLLYSTRVGLFAALALSFAPYDIYASQVIKPDATTSLFSVLALIGAIVVRQRRGGGWVVLAGALVGCAVSCRYNAVPIGILVAAALLTSRPPRQALAALLVAAVVSIAVFILLNPLLLQVPSMYVNALQAMRGHYATKSVTRGIGHLGLFWMLVKSLPGRFLLGAIFGLLAYTALVPMTRGIVSWLARGDLLEQSSGRDHALLLSFPFLHTILNCVSSDLWLPQHFLVLFPFLAIAAGWGVDGLLRASRERFAGNRVVTWTVPTVLAAAALTWMPRAALRVYQGNGIETTVGRVIDDIATTSRAAGGDVMSFAIDPPTRTVQGRQLVAIEHLAQISKQLAARARWLVLDERSARRRLQERDLNDPLRVLLSSPRTLFVKRIAAAGWHTTGRPLLLFKLAEREEPVTLAATSVVGPGAWQMNGEAYQGRVLDDGWVVDPFLRHLGAGTLSLDLGTKLPEVVDAELTLELAAFCKSPNSTPTIDVTVAETLWTISLDCVEAWRSYVLNGIQFSERGGALTVSPPVEDAEILLLGAVHLRIAKSVDALTERDRSLLPSPPQWFQEVLALTSQH